MFPATAQPMHQHAGIFWPIWWCCRCIILQQNSGDLISNLLTKAAMLLSCTKCSETKLLLPLWLINANSLPSSSWRTALWLHQEVRSTQTTQ